jgi:hypothetical protein
MHFMTAEDRYQRDPLFHRLVDLMCHQITELQLTPTEMREAAMLACIKFEQMHPRPMVFDPRHQSLVNWMDKKATE